MLRPSRLSLSIFGSARQLSRASPLQKPGRQVLVPNYPLKTTKGKTVSIEVAEYSDLPMMKQYLKENFAVEEPVMVANKCSPKRLLDEVLSDLLEVCVHFPYTTLAFDGDQMIGYNLVWLELFDKNSNTPPKEGYTDLGDLSKQYAKNIRLSEQPEIRTVTTINYAASLCPHFLPPAERHVVAHGEMGSVNKKYNGNHLVTALIVEGAKEILKDNLVQYYYATATAAATVHMNPLLGLHEVWSMKYKDYKFDGQQIYGDGVLHDGNDRITLNIGKIEDVVNSEYYAKLSEGK
ncbi:unnamed protein product [Bursaphelenchus xylophilus]|uniref:(pine wood nematode) hypothetical protein n=1 Tax=Bursaphelenchus xylophilus TaxID=6326 RepID=A0A1I7RUR5_BURXY|nr:unnamed protein product [Bursaphelenchus xylophilus]CAG9105546.1 unnamed protein product [Bursaphelenchus xylophilus]